MARPSKSATGGLPPPEILVEYEKIIPGSAKQLLDAALKQGEHRQAIERDPYYIARRGQYLGFVIGIAALVAGAFCAYHEQQIAGSFIGAGGVVGLVSVFVLGRMKLGETTVEK